MLYNLNELYFKIKLEPKNVRNVYCYGSRVYGTFSSTSDYDFIFIIDDKNEESLLVDNLNVIIYNVSEFEKLITEHEVSALECLFLKDEFVLKKEILFNFTLNLPKLRNSFSKKASNSWVKSKKKFIIPEDRNIYIAKKSLFHSFRIIDFGMQIAKYKEIISYKSMNYLWREINENDSENWDIYERKYKKFHNKLMTDFRILAPKEDKNG